MFEFVSVSLAQIAAGLSDIAVKRDCTRQEGDKSFKWLVHDQIFEICCFVLQRICASEKQ